MYPSEAA